MKCRSSFLLLIGLLLPISISTPGAQPPGKKYDFPIYTNKPPGRQLSGPHAPATTPALTPEQAQKKFTVPPGFEVRLFAAEPEVVNPVAMTWDERGRLWVVELYEYPLGAKPGEKPRDRIKILEDTDADGRADKVTVFADGFSLATGILLGYGGAIVGVAPDLLFLEDTDGDDKADKRTVLKTGFGMEDRHELLNSFTWGPDGWLYMTHGVFTHSKVRDPNDPNSSGVIMNAAVARFHPRTKKFEVFADGTSNPWGVDFDRYGNAYVSACVIDHLFHLTPGGIYVRQSGAPTHPYAYQLLPSIVDHRHHMAAYSGVQVYQGHQYPEEYRGTILMGNIHDNAVHQDKLTADGSSFRASFVRDFVRANDGWFMPVSTQIGPDGAAWIMDWYDKYPCYQNANADPEGIDREHGRIWRVVYTGNTPGRKVPSRPQTDMNLAKRSSAELVQLIAHPNIWHRRTAQRLLSERRDPQTKGALTQLARNGSTLEARLSALWTLQSSGQLDEATLDQAAQSNDAAVRSWAARFCGERGEATPAVLDRLEKLARDSDASVRLAVATAMRQFVSGSLTVNTPPAAAMAAEDLRRILQPLIYTSAKGPDPLLPFMIWMAVEPQLAAAPGASLNWLLEHGGATVPLSSELARKAMRRICDTQQSAALDAAVEFLMAMIDRNTAVTAAALDGLIEGQKGRAIPPTRATTPLIEKLSSSGRPEIFERAQRLGALWGDASALRTLIATIQNSAATPDDRIKAIQTARQSKSDAVRNALLDLVRNQAPERIAIEAMRALGEVGGERVGQDLLAQWKNYSPALKRAAFDLLASRGTWSRALLDALENKIVAVSEVPAPVVRSLVQSRDESIRNRAAQTIGRYRETQADKLKLIAEKKKVVIEGPVDLQAGREVTRKTCLTCHKLHGEGAEVGPDLTGVGRSSLDALLANVIDPNQIIGKGYENVEIETKDGRTVSGRLVENTDTRIKLLAAGPKEEVVSKSDIGSMRVSELSVMPEGLEQMPEADFRNMIWFILSPPEDGKPLTPQRRQELIGEGHPSAQIREAVDGESVALWNPEWRVHAPEFEGTPRKLFAFEGRNNVLETHPFNRQEAAAIERTVELPSGSRSMLQFDVAAHEEGNWELRVFADDRLLHKQIVDKSGDRWKRVRVDLSSLAGRKVKLRLENFANDWHYEFAYWSHVHLHQGNLSSAAIPAAVAERP
jgi:putative membrane-bound dehydrogenase-like protein